MEFSVHLLGLRSLGRNAELVLYYVGSKKKKHGGWQCNIQKMESAITRKFFRRAKGQRVKGKRRIIGRFQL